MTQLMRLESRVGEDGILRLSVPLAASDANLDVVITIQAKLAVTERKADSGWPPGYFEQTYGSLATDPLMIPDDPAPKSETIE